MTVDPTAVDPPTSTGTGTSTSTSTDTDTGTTASLDSTGTSGSTTAGDDPTSSTTTGECLDGEILCDGECIDPLTDPDYCGATDDCMEANAGTMCGGDQECVNGACACLVGVLCDGVCIDPQTDPLYCGASGDCMGANAGEICSPAAECAGAVCDDTCDNCGFETGDFTGWTVVDLADPYLALAVDPGGYADGIFGSFTTTPTEGGFCAVTGFDGGGPGTIELGQDITLAAAPAADLLFDYRAGWDLASFGAMVDRTFEVRIEPAGGGMPMDTITVLTAPAGNLTADTGDLQGMIDLSLYAGQTIFIRFVFDVPEAFSGPALAQLDNVRIVPQ